MTTVLVTGGCGFIASNFLNIMKERYPEIKFINLDKLDYCSNMFNVKPGVSTFVKGDICDEDLVERAARGRGRLVQVFFVVVGGGGGELVLPRREERGRLWRGL